jgi:hypothetical protein
MIRLAAILFTLIALACGGDDGQQPGAGAPAGGTGEADEVSAGAADPSVQGCLDMVRAGRYADAIAPCTEAVRRAPENREVQTALEKARSGAAEAAAGARQGAEQAADEAASGAADAAAKGLGDALP